MSSSRKPKKDPSQVAKDRIASILEQDVEECGKIARYVRQHSNSKDVLLKAAKKTASQEPSMDNTLMNLRQIEGLLERSLDQANLVGRSMENTAQVLNQIHHIK